MKIDLVALCDAAVDVGGRLHILGTIDYFWATSLPYVHPKCTVAVRFRWEGHEKLRKQKLRIQIVDADGLPISTEFSKKFAAPPLGHEDVPLVRHLILNLESLRFDNFGPYAVRIEVDGEELVSLPFSIVCLHPHSSRQAAC